MVADIDVLLRKLRAIGHLSLEHEAALKRLPVAKLVFERGDDVVTDGTIMNHSCIVLSGMLHRHKTMKDGNRQILSFHAAGDIPDLQSLHLRKVDYTLSATTRSVVGTISHADIRAMLAEVPDLTDLLWRDTLIDSAKFLTWMMLIGQASAEARMAHLFCEIYTRLRAVGDVEGNTFQFPATQGDLADALGMSIVHANRTLQVLRAEAMLVFANGRGEILNWQRLSKLGQFDASYLHMSQS
jgi:CRP-like cAMP-binding protein